jgi:hypothetical protein
MAAARRCIDVCEGHEAPAFERFFAHAAMAIAARDAGDDAAFAEARERALAHHADVPADERGWCDADFAKLGVS